MDQPCAPPTPPIQVILPKSITCQEPKRVMWGRTCGPPTSPHPGHPSQCHQPLNHPFSVPGHHSVAPPFTCCTCLWQSFSNGQVWIQIMIRSPPMTHPNHVAIFKLNIIHLIIRINAKRGELAHYPADNKSYPLLKKVSWKTSHLPWQKRRKAGPT